MNILKFSLVFIFNYTFIFNIVLSQNNYNKIDSLYNDSIKLNEVVITGNRIELPFAKNSRTIEVILNDEIKTMPVNNVIDLLQNVAGLDIRRRGTDGMQADLYIRGGNFEQTLLLIDGVKMEDPQTGHHIMNGVLPISVIKQIEIIKGPAARIYGQNAFTGAINIVTKKVKEDALSLQTNYGSFNNFKAELGVSEQFKNGSVLASFGYQQSDGYRFNTDFINKTAFIKADINKFELVSSLSDRKFGANGFYASPLFKNQYEEVQTSLVALSRKLKLKKITLTPRVYWRRNKDTYLFLRHNPDFYKNIHESNKFGGEVNININSNFGKTGFGIDIANIDLVSNNLGNHNRNAFTSFLEHRLELFSDKLDITPGVALSHYSDFGTNVFPGIDIGFALYDNLKLYGNAGYTYRVPSFTDLYYKGQTNIGNENLKPESALAEELGFKYITKKINLSTAIFHRKSDNLIDWTKNNENYVWQSQNFSSVVTYGLETNFKYLFKKGKLNINYTYIIDDIKNDNVKYTLYSLNSIRNQLNTSFTYNILPNFYHTISYRFIERTLGDNYQVFDTKLTANFNNKVNFYASINNLFNESYTETSLVPMPKSVITIGIKYNIPK